MINQDKKGKTESKRVVLAYGETTGHAHAFYGEDTVVLEGNKLIVKKEDQLRHEEHHAHTVNPGIGEVTIQREYQMGQIKRVAD
jgi:hypothetical protein